MFFPGSSNSAHALDAGMRAALADSFEHIHAVAAAQIGSTDRSVADLTAEVRAHRVAPAIFGRYYDLVLAIGRQDYDDASALFREITAMAQERPRLSIISFGEETLGSDAVRFSRLVDFESGKSVLEAPPDQQFTAFRETVGAALKIIAEADQELAAEISGLVVQIVAAVPSPGSRGFGGSSSFTLWGAILLNAHAHLTPFKMVEGIVHEAAHQYLFGFAARDRLVVNSIEDRFHSPLRKDPRPMDGVFHATFVCARLHYVFGRLKQMLSSTSVSDEMAIGAIQDDQRQRFFDGLDVVQRFGQLTETGKRIMDATSDYMRSAA